MCPIRRHPQHLPQLEWARSE